MSDDQAQVRVLGCDGDRIDLSSALRDRELAIDTLVRICQSPHAATPLASQALERLGVRRLRSGGFAR